MSAPASLTALNGARWRKFCGAARTSLIGTPTGNLPTHQHLAVRPSGHEPAAVFDVVPTHAGTSQRRLRTDFTAANRNVAPIHRASAFNDDAAPTAALQGRPIRLRDRYPAPPDPAYPIGSSSTLTSKLTLSPSTAVAVTVTPYFVPPAVSTHF